MSLCSVLEKNMPTFKVSEPVFDISVADASGYGYSPGSVIQIARGGTSATAELAQGENCIGRLFVDSFSERFNGTKYIFDKDALIGKVMNKVVNSIAETYLKVSNNKSPKQTHVYKFLRNYDIANADLNDHLANLYEYSMIEEIREEDTLALHKANFLNILNVLRDKYGKR